MGDSPFHSQPPGGRPAQGVEVGGDLRCDLLARFEQKGDQG